MTNSAVVLGQARELVHQPRDHTTGLWPRAAALLARQALEAALDQLWERRAPALAQLSARSQLACLPEYLRDETLAGDIAYTWVVLSEACHHRGYEMGPTAEELESRFAVVDRLLQRLAAVQQA